MAPAQHTQISASVSVRCAELEQGHRQHSGLDRLVRLVAHRRRLVVLCSQESCCGETRWKQGSGAGTGRLRGVWLQLLGLPWHTSVSKRAPGACVRTRLCAGESVGAALRGSTTSSHGRLSFAPLAAPACTAKMPSSSESELMGARSCAPESLTAAHQSVRQRNLCSVCWGPCEPGGHRARAGGAWRVWSVENVCDAHQCAQPVGLVVEASA